MPTDVYLCIDHYNYVFFFHLNSAAYAKLQFSARVSTEYTKREMQFLPQTGFPLPCFSVQVAVSYMLSALCKCFSVLWSKYKQYVSHFGSLIFLSMLQRAHVMFHEVIILILSLSGVVFLCSKWKRCVVLMQRYYDLGDFSSPCNRN